LRLGAVRALVAKDLKIFLSDRRAVIMTFVAPIAIASFFGYLFQGADDREAAKVPVGVVDEDGSPIAQKLGAGLAGDKMLTVERLDAATARAKVRDGKLAVAILLPKGFGDAAGRSLFGGGQGKPSMTVLYDPSKGTERAMVNGLVTQHVMEAVSGEVFAGSQGRSLMRDQLAALDKDTTLGDAERLALRRLIESSLAVSEQSAAPGGGTGGGGFTVPYTTTEEAVTARPGMKYNSYAHAFAGMGVQFLLFACIDLAMLMLNEREQGLWKRLRAAPLSRGELLVARGTSAALISLLVLAVTFTFGMAVFGIRVEGSWAAFVAVCVATGLMASAFGLLVAVLGKTVAGSRGVAVLAVLLMVMLGGAWVPSFVFPAWIQAVTVVVPARWAVDGLDAATWRGASLAAVMPAVGALLAFASLFAGICVARFRWDVD
jgi:ABC-2 type transport system permease protein